MDVEKGNLEQKYQDISYSFCSRQCYDRFTANPHLYIGQPGKPSAKQRGQSVIRKRTLNLETPVPDDVQEQIMDVLNAMMGVKTVIIETNSIQIIYDLLEVSAKQIESALEENGGKLSKNWSMKLKRAFIHYLEETELDNIEHGNDSRGCHSDKNN